MGVTCDDDLEIIFSRFGQVVSCEVIKDRVSGDSLQYAFVEFGDRAACEQAYFKMDNVLIDDRRIHVDFSQSVSKYSWKGKGRLEVLDDKKHEEKKKVDLKELINKERAEIKTKGDGKIERNEKNMQGKSTEEYYRDKEGAGYKRGSGREDRRRDDRYGREDQKRYDQRNGDHGLERPGERGSREDRPRERDEKDRRRDFSRKEDRSKETRREGNDNRVRRDEGDTRKSKFEREDSRKDRDRRDDRLHVEKDRYDRRGEDRDDRQRGRVDQFGRERVEKRRESSGSDSGMEKRKKSRKQGKRRESSSSSSD